MEICSLKWSTLEEVRLREKVSTVSYNRPPSFATQASSSFLRSLTFYSLSRSFSPWSFPASLQITDISKETPHSLEKITTLTVKTPSCPKIDTRSSSHSTTSTVQEMQPPNHWSSIVIKDSKILKRIIHISNSLSLVTSLVTGKLLWFSISFPIQKTDWLGNPSNLLIWIRSSWKRSSQRISILSIILIPSWKLLLIPFRFSHQDSFCQGKTSEAVTFQLDHSSLWMIWLLTMLWVESSLSLILESFHSLTSSLQLLTLVSLSVLWFSFALIFSLPGMCSLRIRHRRWSNTFSTPRSRRRSPFCCL